MQPLTTFGDAEVNESSSGTFSESHTESSDVVSESGSESISDSYTGSDVSSASRSLSPEEEEKEDFSLFKKDASYAGLREEVKGSTEEEIAERVKQLGTVDGGLDYVDNLRLLFHKVFRSKTSIALTPAEVFDLHLGLKDAYFFKAERTAAENLYHFLVYLSACVNNSGLMAFYTLLLDIPQDVFMLDTQLLMQDAVEASEVVKIDRPEESGEVDLLEVNVVKKILKDDYSMHTGVPFYNVFKQMEANPLKFVLPPRRDTHDPPQALDNQIIMLPIYPKLAALDEAVEVVQFVYE